MYGTIARVRPKPGQEQALDEVGRRWISERAPKVNGFLGGYHLKSETNPGEVLTVTLFDSKENYRKNADDPEQRRWYEQFRELLVADPEWNDGEVISADIATVPL